MNIKTKLIEQLEVLENLQILATQNNQFDTALSTSGTILEYIRTIDMANEREEHDEPDKPFICQAREEAKLQATLIADIADEAGVSTLIVKAVLDAQSVVLDLDEEECSCREDTPFDICPSCQEILRNQAIPTSRYSNSL